MLPSSVCWRQHAMHHIDGASIDWRLLQCLMSGSTLLLALGYVGAGPMKGQHWITWRRINQWESRVSRSTLFLLLCYLVTLHSEVGWTHRGFRLDVSRNLPYESQNFRTMSGNRVPKRKIWSEIPIPRNGRSKFSPDVVSFYAEKILFVIVGKIFEQI